MSTVPELEVSQAVYNKVSRWSMVFSPLFLLVPVALWLCFDSAGVPTNWAAIGLGALGWMLALGLRFPVMFLIRKWPQNRGIAMMAAVSGPLEEAVRLGVLTVTGMTFATAMSVGQGWAAIEVVNTFATVIVRAALFKRTDEKAMQAKQVLAAQSGGKVSSNPVWGLAERVFASGYHIGATLWIAHNPWWVAGFIPFHSLFNYGVLRIAQKSLAGFMGVMVLVGSSVFIGGWVLFH